MNEENEEIRDVPSLAEGKARPIHIPTLQHSNPPSLKLRRAKQLQRAASNNSNNSNPSNN